MTTPNPDLLAWARGQLSDDELEQRTGLSPQQAQYTDDARAVWFADPLRYEDMTSDEFTPNDWWQADEAAGRCHDCGLLVCTCDEDYADLLETLDDSDEGDDEPRHGMPPGWRDEHGTWHAPVCPGPENGCMGNGYDVPCDWWAADEQAD